MIGIVAETGFDDWDRSDNDATARRIPTEVSRAIMVSMTP